jgi:ATP-dependent Clp protease ATP-binding subunit ClpB
MQLEIERPTLKKEKDAPSRERPGKIEAIEAEVASLRADGDALKARWQLEKESVQALRADRPRENRDRSIGRSGLTI